MTFRTDTAETFLSIFEQYKSRIRHTQGCTHLSLLRDVNQPTVFFTYSHWEAEEYLEAYRLSATFGDVWPQVKPLFGAPAEAWTVSEEIVP
ncbi:MAG: putative quinol monooxygenase [Flavobacteriales bacterium]|jgi:quinol monooxygenase YgiN